MLRHWIERTVFLWPSRERFETPPTWRDVWIDGPQRLHGWHLPGPPGAPAVLHVHGNAGNIGDHVGMSVFLWRAGMHVFIFDYRGFGQSEGRVGPRRQLLADANNALDAVLALPGVDPGRVGVLGVSLGGVIGLALAAARPEVRAIASVAAFARWKLVARDHAGALGHIVMRSGLDAADSVAALGTRPLLIVHGTQDETVPLHHAERLAVAAREAGVDTSVKVVEAGHNDVVSVTTKTITNFFDTALRS